MSRLCQAALVAGSLIASWLAMQAVHELGHVGAAWATGGTVTAVVLHPLAISRTDVSPNPAPLAVAWAGPLVGCAVPLGLAAASRMARRAVRRYAEFFAGFCLIANGAYLALGTFDAVGDAGDILRHGSPPWLLIAFGASALAGGIWLWHAASDEFGYGPTPRPIAAREACWALAVAAALTTAAALFGRR
jgi:hypothetical protein